MNDIQKKIQYIYKKISLAAYDAHRDPKDITLIAVTKNQSIDSIKNAICYKQQNHFGESYAQEAFKKICWFRENTKNKLIWHFIGPVQSNKSRIIAENFDWCHTLNCPKLAYRLNAQRPKILDHLNVLIQIKISDSQSRSGISSIDHMFKLAEMVHQHSRLKLRGIMSMSIPSQDFKQQLLQFKTIYIFFQQLKSVYAYVDTLSLGMSNDMLAAVYAGSNLLRIGTAIFGSQPILNNI